MEQSESMEVYKIEKPVKVFYITATSFPEGIKSAWEKLHALLPSTKDRNYYGISHGSKDGSIIYKAAVEQAFDGEGKTYGCETFIIPAGDYIGRTIINYMQNIPEIGNTFQALLHHPEFDDSVPCLEKYISEKEMICMVKKKESSKLSQPS